MSIPILLLASFALLASCDLQANTDLPVPDPQDYPAAQTFKGVPAEPILDTKLKRMYRTRIRQGAKEGPNFAGHFTVVTWGCGMDSYMLVVADAISGQVFEPPFGCITLANGFGLSVAGLTTSANPGYRLDSRLLLVIGVEDKEDADPKDRSATVYVFDRGAFKAIFNAPAPLDE